jgi:hypothetical protein
MATLIDSILQKNSTQELKDQLQKTSGKAVTASPFSQPVDASQEEAVKTDLNQAWQGQKKEQNLQQSELNLQTKKADFQQATQKTELQKRGENIRTQFLQQASTLLTKAKEATENLSFAKKQSMMNTAMTLAKLSNQTYVDKLKDAGARSRLSNKVRFQEEMLAAVFRDEEDTLNADLGFKNMLRQDQRSFLSSMKDQGMSLEMALALSGIKQAAGEQIVSGVGGMVSGGAKIWANRTPSTPTVQTPEANIITKETDLGEDI